MRTTKSSLLVLLTAGLTAFGADEVASTNEASSAPPAATPKEPIATENSASTTSAASAQPGQDPAPSPENSAMDLDKIPVRSIGSLLRDVETRNGVLVHLRGTVLDQRPGETIVIRDDTGTISARTTQNLAVKLQAAVDVWGTLAENDNGIVLRNATFRVADQPASAEATGTASERPAELPLLTKVRQVRELTPDQAGWEYPVKLRAVVTLFLPPPRSKLYVADETSGINVRIRGIETGALKPGDAVELSGVSNPGWFMPVVVPTNVAVVGAESLPEPRQTSLFQLASGRYDSQWVEAHGVVRAVKSDGEVSQLKLSDRDGTFFVNVPSGNGGAPTNLVDAVVRVRGVCVSQFNNKRQITGVALWASSLDSIQIEQSGEIDPLSLPVQPIVSLSQFQAREQLQRRVKVAGVVTLCEPGQSFFVQDAEEGIQVFASQKMNLKQGDRVEVAGYPALGNYGTVLRDAVFKVTGSGSLPAPKPLAEGRALDPQLHGNWVQVDARLLDDHEMNLAHVLTLQFGSTIFEARSAASASDKRMPAVGSTLQLTGVYRVLADETRAPMSFQLIVPSTENIQVLAHPSRLTFRHTMLAIGSMAAISGVAILWVMVLRRKVHEQTAILQQNESKFRSLVEQSLVGVYIIQDDRFVYVNPRLAEIFGYGPEEMIETCTVSDAICEEDRAFVQEHIQKRLDGELVTVHYHFRGQRKDGSRVFVEVLGSRTDYEGSPAVLGTLLDITARKQAEEQLVLQTSALESVANGIMITDRAGQILWVNPAFTRLTGYSAEEAVGKTPALLKSGVHDGAFYEELWKTVLGGKQWHGELVNRRKDGSHYDEEMTITPVLDANGEIRNFVAVKQDISERKRANADLAEASSLLDTLLENVPDYIYFKDAKSRFVRFSKSFEKLFHLEDVSSLKGKTDFDFFLKEHAQLAFDDEQSIMRTGEPIIGKLETEAHPDGRVTQALTTKMAWRDQDGNIIGTFGISKDVTTIKETEARLEYERDLLRALLNNFPDVIYFKDLQSRFVRVSRSKAERSLTIMQAQFRATHPDAKPEETPAHLVSVEKFNDWLIGKSDFDTFVSERARAAYEDEQEIIRTGKPMLAKVERTPQADNKVTWCISTKMAWRDKDGKIIGTFGVSKDITALKEAEAELEHTHKRLLETSRLAGMAEVATDVLHNVGNVLNSVNVSCSLTIDRVKASKISSLSKVSALLEENRNRLGDFFTNDPRGQQIPSYVAALTEHFGQEQSALLQELEQLIKHIDHIKQIVAMQQSYAKVAGVIEVINPAQLVEDALHINAAALTRHDVHVERDFQDAPVLHTEKHKVLQILVNLIRNAKYALDDAKRTDKIMTIRIGKGSDEHVKIQVIDNGVGIPPENLTRIFGHGFTTRRNGHGFGLHSSALAIKELGGSLLADSEGVGKGATFTLLLPQKPAQAQEKAA